MNDLVEQWSQDQVNASHSESDVTVGNKSSEDHENLIENSLESHVEKMTDKIPSEDATLSGKDFKQGGKARGSSLLKQGCVTVYDKSDPLQNYQKSKDETIFYTSQTLQEKTLKQCHKFKSVLSEVLLSASPYIQYTLPYLVSKDGANCANRRFFPEEIYWSAQFEIQSFQSKRQKLAETPAPNKPAFTWSDIEVVEAHPLVKCQLTSPASDKKIQVMFYMVL